MDREHSEIREENATLRTANVNLKIKYTAAEKTVAVLQTEIAVFQMLFAAMHCVVIVTVFTAYLLMHTPYF
jgi:hypothetical protein